MQSPGMTALHLQRGIHPYRINSVDLLRGLIMIIMALDHTRDFFHSTAWNRNPLDLSITTPYLFFTRWITHFCAPTFVFLSGVSIYLQSFRKTKKELSTFLIKRGLWLILLELTIINFSFSFDIYFTTITLQVIWAIGISMVILGLIIRLPYQVLLVIGLVIVFGHNLMDYVEQKPNQQLPFIWDLIHRTSFHPIGKGHFIGILYPFLPWTGLMILGYCCGRLFSKDVDPTYRRKMLVSLGWMIIGFFLIVRATNIYGDPAKWSIRNNILYSILSFINTTKYPPSLLFLCMTIGPGLIFLAYTEGIQNRLTRIITVYGRVPLFYFVVHFYILHFVSMLLFFARGHTLQEGLNAPKGFPVNFIIPGDGYRLTIVYLVWIGIVLLMYPLCKWYGDYKVRKKWWWLSYL